MLLLHHALFAPAIRQGPGSCFCSDDPAIPWNRVPSKLLALPVGLAPTLDPQTTGCFAIQLRKHKMARQAVALAKAGGKRSYRPSSSLPVLFNDIRFTVG